jgi:hypothetical protein
MDEGVSLRPAQIDDLAALIANKRFGLWSDPAVGKTIPVCVYTYYLWTETQTKTVWAMPKSLLKKNYDELLRFTRFEPKDVLILETPPKQVKALKLMTGILTFKEGNFFLDKRKVGAPFVHSLMEQGIFEKSEKDGPVSLTDVGRTILDRNLFADSCHYDAKVILMGFDFFSANWPWILHFNPEINALSVDEIHMGWSDIKAQRTQSFIQAMNHIERFVPMTGTLINGRLSSAYPTIHVMEPRYYAGYDQFMAEHAIKDFGGTIIGWDNHAKIKEILGRHGRSRSFTEEYGPEAKLVITETIVMSPKQRELYDEFHDKALLELEDTFLDGTLPGVAVIRARQIMQCPELFKLCAGEVIGKDEYLKVHLADNEPLLIFSVFQAEHARIAEMIREMGRSVAVINGNTSRRHRSEIDEGFRDGSIQNLVASPACAGVGFNWGHIDRVICLSLDYQDGNFSQGYRRAIRGKRDKPLRIYVPQYERSVDQRVFQIIDRKAQDANLVDPKREMFGLARR